VNKLWFSLFGGLLVSASAFFKLATGPWGAEITFWGLVTHNWTISNPVMLSMAWPIVFGAIICALTVLRLLSRPATERLEYAGLLIFLLSVSGTHLILFMISVTLNGSFPAHNLIPFGVELAAFLALSVIMFMRSAIHRKVRSVYIVGSAWSILYALTFAQWMGGLGFILLLSGSAIVLVVNLLNGK